MYSQKKILRTLTLIVVLIVVGMFVFAYMNRSEELDEDSALLRIDATHVYEYGVHTMTGELTMPTPCDVVEHTVTVAESYPEQVHIMFTVRTDGDVCAQVLTVRPFEVSFAASANARIQATLAGHPVVLNLIEG